MIRIKTRILKRVIIVTLISFLFCLLFLYIYYTYVLKEQIKEDDYNQLLQTSMQLRSFSNDIATYTAAIIISNQVQHFLRDYEAMDKSESYFKISELNSYLKSFINLKNEIVGITVITSTEETFWSEDPFNSTALSYWDEAWLQDFLDSGKSLGFTTTHLLPHSLKAAPNQTISYVARIIDLKSQQKEIGTVIIHLDYAYLHSILTLGSRGFDELLWLGEDGHLLFQNREASHIDIPSLLQRASMNRSDGIVEEQTRSGYMYWDRNLKTGWNVIAFNSYHSSFQRIQHIVLILFLFVLASTTLVISLLLQEMYKITMPIIQLYRATNAVSDGNLNIKLNIKTGDELETLGSGFNHMTEQIQKHLDQNIAYEKEKQQHKIELLTSQFNPHFIYNTLNTVIYLANQKKVEDIHYVVVSLINILQDALKVGEEYLFTTVEDEIRILKDYIVIQSLRYKHKFSVVWDINEYSKNCLIPRNIIQPFLENAIFHGICPKKTDGIISVQISFVFNKLQIVIADDGIGMTSNELQSVKNKLKLQPSLADHKHIGISNTYIRLNHLLHNNVTLDIHSSPQQGTTLTIQMPRFYNHDEIKLWML